MDIDWNRLNALKADIGEDDFTAVVALFMAEIREKLHDLEHLPASHVAGDFHFLRGSASNLGFTAMAEACLRAEQVCARGQRPDIAAISHRFETALHRIESQIPGIADAA